MRFLCNEGLWSVYRVSVCSVLVQSPESLSSLLLCSRSAIPRGKKDTSLISPSLLHLDNNILTTGNKTKSRKCTLPVDFGVLEKDSALNQMRSLLSMRCMLLGYSFKPSANSRALGTAGSVMSLGLI